MSSKLSASISEPQTTLNFAFDAAASASSKLSLMTSMVISLMKIERYYSSVKEEVTPLAEDAYTLLENKDYIGFFKACGPNYIRSIRRVQEVMTTFKFTSASSEMASAFSASLTISSATAPPSLGGPSITAEKSGSSKFSLSMSSLEINIRGYGMGLSQDGSETMVATSISEYREVMIFSFKSMTQAEDSHAVGMVYGMEVVPWINNVAFQAAAKLQDENIVLNQPRSLIERAALRNTTDTTAFVNDESTRALFRCKSDAEGISIDKFGYCCETGQLYDSASESYYSEEGEVCLDASLCNCKPIFTLDKALVKDNMANNGEFVARLDNAMRYKMASIATLEKCISATRNIPEKFNNRILKSQDSVQYDKDVTLEISVIELKHAVDPLGDYGMLKHLTYELDEWIAMYYSPCLGEIYGMTTGSTPTADASYIMAYPWYKHGTCMMLSCIVNNMRWDRANGGGCVPSLVTGYSSTEYGSDEDAEPHCAKKWEVDSEMNGVESCKYPTEDLLAFQTDVKECWNATLVNSNIDYLINNFCMPQMTNEMLDDARIAEIEPETFCTSSR